MPNLIAIQGDARVDLDARVAAGRCVTYANHPLPAGIQPRASRVGVETEGNRVLLHVQRGLRYTGADPELSQWVATGTRAFSTVDDAVAWLTVKVAASAGTPRTEPPAPSGRPLGQAPSVVTDLTRVTVREAGRISAEDLVASLGESVFGQDRAIEVLATGAARHVAKPFPRRPWSTIMIGPTGVGKTLLAERLAETLREETRQPWRYLRLDMAEFTERHTVSKLTGAPPGYVGYGDPGLSTALAGEPRHVVLFDEIEKAHPEVLLSLMNLIDAGRLDSAHSRATAEKAILLFTSNLGANDVRPGEDAAEDDRTGRQNLLAHGMRPELVARFGHVLILGNLEGSDLAAAATHAISTIAADYGKRVVRLDADYLSTLLSENQGSRLGVRALEHRVDRELGPLLADCPGIDLEILDGPLRVNPVPAEAASSDRCCVRTGGRR